MGVLGQNKGNTIVTAPVGAGLQATADKLVNVREITIDFDGGMIRVKERDGRIVQYPYDDISTMFSVIMNRVTEVTAQP